MQKNQIWAVYAAFTLTYHLRLLLYFEHMNVEWKRKAKESNLSSLCCQLYLRKSWKIWIFILFSSISCFALERVCVCVWERERERVSLTCKFTNVWVSGLVRLHINLSSNTIVPWTHECGMKKKKQKNQI